MQRQAAVRDFANIEAAFGRKQLALVVDRCKHAGHEWKRVRGDQSRREVSLEQGSLQDIEPPGGVGRRIIGAALAQNTMMRRENGGGDFLHAIFLKAGRTVTSPRSDTARYEDRFVRGRAAPADSPDGSVRRDRPAAPNRPDYPPARLGP